MATLESEQTGACRVFITVPHTVMGRDAADKFIGRLILEAHKLHHTMDGNGLRIEKLNVFEGKDKDSFEIELQPNETGPTNSKAEVNINA